MQKFYKSLKNKADKTQVEDPNKIRYVGLNARMMTNMVDMLVVLMLMLPFLFFVDFTQVLHPPKTLPPQLQQVQAAYEAGQITEQQRNTNVLAYAIANFFKALFFTILILGAIFIASWKKFDSTPGKMLLKIKIVDAKTFKKPTIGQYIIRFFGYIISALPFFLGFFLVGLNKRKRGLHDMLAGTAVIYSEPLNPEWEKKKFKYQSYFMLVVLIFGIIYISKVFN